jgi:hypothetical protein
MEVPTIMRTVRAPSAAANARMEDGGSTEIDFA